MTNHPHDTKLVGAVERAIIDGVANHTEEWANPFMFKNGNFTHKQLEVILDGMVNNKRLRKNLVDLITSARSDWAKEVIKEIETMPHYVRSKFADHVEVTKEDYADMLIADEVTKVLKEYV